MVVQPSDVHGSFLGNMDIDKIDAAILPMCKILKTTQYTSWIIECNFGESVLVTDDFAPCDSS